VSTTTQNKEKTEHVALPVDLRDYFAAKAMTAMVSAGFQSGAFRSADTSRICAAGAYEIADAMLKERAK